jgi:hypothetical protein
MSSDFKDLLTALLVPYVRDEQPVSESDEIAFQNVNEFITQLQADRKEREDTRLKESEREGDLCFAKAKEFVDQIQEDGVIIKGYGFTPQERLFVQQIERRNSELKERYRWEFLWARLIEKHNKNLRLKELATFIRYYIACHDADDPEMKTPEI